MRLSVRALACALALTALLAAHVSATTVEATESAIDAALAAEEAEHADAARDAELDRTETRAEARHEMGIHMPEGASLLEVGNDKADSGGCTPLTVWENYDKNSYWWNWEKRLPDLARRTVGVDDGTASETVFHALGDNLWMQYIDGWAHDKGANAFGAEYVNDMRQASGVVGGRLKNGFGPRTFGLGFYDHIHSIAFQQTAGLLNKVNGFRGENSWIYLPVPDKPLGVFHDIHNYGKLNYDPHLRVIDTIKGTYGLNWNGGIQYRWVYPNVPVAFGRQKVRELFRKFWFDLSKIRQADPIGVQREQALQAVVLLYHSLENFHCFVDGNGRTNILVLQSLLSFVGLHPVSFYNSMESALCSVEEMREKVLEGYFRWEDVYRSGRSPWSQHELARKAGECKRAIDQLMGHAPTWNFGAAQGQTPDTMGGCTCRDVNSCNSNGLFNGNQWCFTDSSCTWTWDYCAPGRRRR